MLMRSKENYYGAVPENIGTSKKFFEYFSPVALLKVRNFHQYQERENIDKVAE